MKKKNKTHKRTKERSQFSYLTKFVSSINKYIANQNLKITITLYV